MIESVSQLRMLDAYDWRGMGLPQGLFMDLQKLLPNPSSIFHGCQRLVKDESCDGEAGVEVLPGEALLESPPMNREQICNDILNVGLMAAVIGGFALGNIQSAPALVQL